MLPLFRYLLNLSLHGKELFMAAKYTRFICCFEDIRLSLWLTLWLRLCRVRIIARA